MKPVIMISIKPKYVKEILNGNKTIEIRKRFPKDFVGWVYIYCTKDNNNLLHKNCIDIWWIEDRDFQKENKRLGLKQQPIYNGMVVARFWCEKVDYYEDVCFWSEENEKASCVTPSEFFDYMNHIKCHRSCCLIHITKLEIFEKPKDVSEFYKCEYIEATTIRDSERVFKPYLPLTRAPQSWCYVEVQL